MDENKEAGGLEKLEKEVPSVLENAEALVIADDKGVQLGTETIRAIKQLRNAVNEHYDPLVKAAHDTHKKALAAKKAHAEPLDRAEKVIKLKIGEHVQEVEVRQREEDERRLAEARKEKEKATNAANKRIEKLLEGAKDLEGQLKALYKEYDKPGLSDLEADALSAQMDTIKDKISAAKEQVETKRVEVEEAHNVPAVAPPSAPTPKAQGLSTSGTKIPEVINKKILVQAVAADKSSLPLDLVSINMSVLSKIVKAGMSVPGVTVTTRTDVRVR